MFLRRNRKVSPEVEEAQKTLANMDKLAKKDEQLRRQLDAQLKLLKVELDNLTRREGNIASH